MINKSIETIYCPVCKQDTPHDYEREVKDGIETIIKACSECGNVDVDVDGFIDDGGDPECP